MRVLRVVSMILVLGAGVACADIIITVDGRKIEGEVETEEDGQYVIKTRFGKVTIPANQISRIVEKTSPIDEFREKLADLKLDKTVWESADAHYELGAWAKSRRLHKEAKDCFERALGKDPDHKKTHQALGHVQKDGVWAPRAASLASRPGASGSGTEPRKPSTVGGISSRELVARTGRTPSPLGRWEKPCSKCGGDGIMIERDCMQCNGKGFLQHGGGRRLCNYCRGAGKWRLRCPFCEGSGKHLRGRYTVPVPQQVKIPHGGWMHCPKCSGTGSMDTTNCLNCAAKGYRDVGEGLSLCAECKGVARKLNICVFCGGKGLMKK